MTADALARLAETEDTLRAIGAGEVDAFVVSDAACGPRVFTLATADRPYRMFVENMRDGAATLSSGGLVLYANQRLADLLRCSRETIVGSPLAEFLAGGVQPGLEEVRRRGAPGTTIECDLVDAGGGVVPVQVGVSSLEVDGNDLTCLTFTDLSAHRAKDREIARLSRAQGDRLVELEGAQAALTQQATHDDLTGLPNRALLVDRIDQALSQAERSGSYVAVLFVDLDGFKQVNDTRGHAVGDFTLQRVAGRLVGAVRSMDTVARIGGDEFVVLAPDLDTELRAVDLGSRLIAELSRPVAHAEAGEAVAASVGVCVSVRGRGSAETMLNEADAAMYQAKARGGGRAEVFDAALGRQVEQRSVARRMLQSALDDRRVIAHYQPLIDIATGNVTGFEALARISGRDGSIVMPDAFIGVAEDSGLIMPLGAHVLGVACRAAQGWPRVADAERPLTVAVNLSCRQFAAGDLPAIVQTALGRTGLDAARLHLEITETAVIDLTGDFLEQLAVIRDLGVQVGLDDFGTGYASLTHLRRLPVSFVKIDRSFVHGLGTDSGDERIVSAVVDLAANLGLRSIAEGVETSEQLQRLRELGCIQAQGYFFARPLAPADVPSAIRRLHSSSAAQPPRA